MFGVVFDILVEVLFRKFRVVVQFSVFGGLGPVDVESGFFDIGRLEVQGALPDSAFFLGDSLRGNEGFAVEVEN